MGSVLLLDGCEVVGVDEHGADLMTNAGARQRLPSSTAAARDRPTVGAGGEIRTRGGARISAAARTAGVAGCTGRGAGRGHSVAGRGGWTSSKRLVRHRIAAGDRRTRRRAPPVTYRRAEPVDRACSAEMP